MILFNHDSALRNKKFLLPRIVKAIKEKNENFLNNIYKENIIKDFSHAEDICNAIYLLIRKNVNLMYGYMCEYKKKNKIRILKGDGDRDRPSRIGFEPMTPTLKWKRSTIYNPL